MMSFAVRSNGGYSSAGRAPGCGPGCRGFESRYSPHQNRPDRSGRGGFAFPRRYGPRPLPARGHPSCPGKPGATEPHMHQIRPSHGTKWCRGTSCSHETGRPAGSRPLGGRPHRRHPLTPTPSTTPPGDTHGPEHPAQHRHHRPRLPDHRLRRHLPAARLLRRLPRQRPAEVLLPRRPRPRRRPRHARPGHPAAADRSPRAGLVAHPRRLRAVVGHPHVGGSSCRPSGATRRSRTASSPSCGWASPASRSDSSAPASASSPSWPWPCCPPSSTAATPACSSPAASSAPRSSPPSWSAPSSSSAWCSA